MKKAVLDEQDMMMDMALKETAAQSAILQALRPLTPDRREAVLRAVEHLCEGDRLVPGLLKKFL